MIIQAQAKSQNLRFHADFVHTIIDVVCISFKSPNLKYFIIFNYSKILLITCVYPLYHLNYLCLDEVSQYIMGYILGANVAQTSM